MSAQVTRPKRTKRERPQGPTGPERLQKLLARAGYGSRRTCEELIREGRVTVDGQEVTEMGTKADPAVQEIRVDGARLKAESYVYYLLNKPKGVVCTSNDPQHRRTVVELIPERRRIFAVGRLDYESRGAVILTNDGRLTNLLTHPRYGVEKTYHVRVRGKPEGEELDGSAAESGCRRGGPSQRGCGSCASAAARPSWGSPSARGRTGRSGGCSPRSATRSSGSPGPESDP